MKREEHEEECRRTLGKPFSEVHAYLDQFAGQPGIGFRHRCKLHHEYGIELVRKQFGDRAAEAARLHIESDLAQEGWAPIDPFPQNEEHYKKLGFF